MYGKECNTSYWQSFDIWKKIIASKWPVWKKSLLERIYIMLIIILVTNFMSCTWLNWEKKMQSWNQVYWKFEKNFRAILIPQHPTVIFVPEIFLPPILLCEKSLASQVLAPDSVHRSTPATWVKASREQSKLLTIQGCWTQHP